jgi:hypothetical protein
MHLDPPCIRVLLALVLWGGAAHALGGQTVRFGTVAQEVRAALDSAWRDDPGQVERAYCVRRARLAAQAVRPGVVDSIFRVLAVRPAEVREAGPNYALFDCPRGTPELHTHSPATCPSDDARWCEAGGPDAYSCQPSRGDYEKLARRGDQFGIIQCDRHTFRFYYPSEYAGTAPVRRAASP